MAEVSLVMLAIVMLTGKSMTVQSALWLVPFAALVGLAWKDVLAWSATEALHFEAVWLYLAGTSAPSRGLPASWYAVFLVIRLGGVLWLLARTWQLALARPPVYDDDGAVVESDWGDERERRAGGPACATLRTGSSCGSADRRQRLRIIRWRAPKVRYPAYMNTAK